MPKQAEYSKTCRRSKRRASASPRSPRRNGISLIAWLTQMTTPQPLHSDLRRQCKVFRETRVVYRMLGRTLKRALSIGEGSMLHWLIRSCHGDRFWYRYPISSVDVLISIAALPITLSFLMTCASRVLLERPGTTWS